MRDNPEVSTCLVQEVCKTFDAHFATWVVEHLVSDWVKLSFVIFEFVVPGCQKLQVMA